MKIIGIIPARYGSTRFPGKPLAMVRGKMMIRRVYEQASVVLKEVIVATDDNRILRAVKNFDGRAMMTSPGHRSGTDRCAEVLEKVDSNYDVVINIQGDEPFIDPGLLKNLASAFNEPGTQIATSAASIRNIKDLSDPDIVKLVMRTDHTALYFSRTAIPYVRGTKISGWLEKFPFYRHTGVYAYRPSVLKEITRLPPGILEEAESLEQNRWIENHYKIKVLISDFPSSGIDTPAQLKIINRGGNL